MWPDNYRKIGHLLDSQEPILVLARPDITDERSNIIIEEAESLVSRRDSSSTIGVIVLNENDDIKSKLPEFIEFMKQHPGDCPVKATIKISGDEMTIAVKDSRGDPIRVKPSAEITEQAEMLFGRQVMSFG